MVLTNVVSSISKISNFTDLMSGDYVYWNELDDKMKTVGSATDELIRLCQNYWFIPLVITVIIVAGLVISGKQGRIEAKSKLFFALVSVAIIMSITSIVALLYTFFTADSGTVSSLAK